MAPGAGCPLCYREGDEINEATCPCGHGYVTDAGLYVSGARIRKGRVVPKDHYKEHIRLCKSCRSGSHQCFWNDDPEDYNQFFVPGAGIHLEVIQKYNDEHGGVQSKVSKVDSVKFKDEPGFWVKSRVEYTGDVIAELQRQSRERGRRLNAQSSRTAGARSSREDIIPPRPDEPSTILPQNSPPTASAHIDRNDALSEGMDTLQISPVQPRDVTSRHILPRENYPTSRYSNPVFPREEHGPMNPPAERVPGPAAAATSTYGSSPSSYAQPSSYASRPSSYASQPASYASQPSSYPAVSSRYPAYTPPTSANAYPSNSASNYMQPQYATSPYQSASARVPSYTTTQYTPSGRPSPEQSRPNAQTPLSRSTPRRYSQETQPQDQAALARGRADSARGNTRDTPQARESRR